MEIAPALFRRDIADGEWRRYWAGRLNAPGTTVAVAETGTGVLTGSILFDVQDRPQSLFTHAHRRLFIEHLVVDPDWRRAGIGAGLMQYAEDRAAALGIGELRLGVWAANAPAQAFFAGAGYQPLNMVCVKRL